MIPAATLVHVYARFRLIAVLRVCFHCACTCCADAVRRTVIGGGKVLIPVYALGRAQELLLILGAYVVIVPSPHIILI